MTCKDHVLSELAWTLLEPTTNDIKVVSEFANLVGCNRILEIVVEAIQEELHQRIILSRP